MVFFSSKWRARFDRYTRSWPHHLIMKRAAKKHAINKLNWLRKCHADWVNYTEEKSLCCFSSTFYLQLSIDLIQYLVITACVCNVAANGNLRSIDCDVRQCSDFSDLYMCIFFSIDTLIQRMNSLVSCAVQILFFSFFSLFLTPDLFSLISLRLATTTKRATCIVRSSLLSFIKCCMNDHFEINVCDVWQLWICDWFQWGFKKWPCLCSLNAIVYYCWCCFCRSTVNEVFVCLKFT